MTLLHILLMAPQGGGLGSFLPLILVMVVFYFFMIYPQMKKNKAQKKFREELKEGDSVITIGGVHGKIERMQDTTFILNSEGTRLKMDRTSISMEASQAAYGPKKEDKK
ncbi:MAG: preprotein translocase subunit YajC [Bacteroidia bacterium]|nr:preprotein translocase subunit YajC [Bacteroidia bacterium]